MKQKQETNHVERSEEGGHFQGQEVCVQGEQVQLKFLKGHMTNRALILQDHLTDMQLEADKTHHFAYFHFNYANAEKHFPLSWFPIKVKKQEQQTKNTTGIEKKTKNNNQQHIFYQCIMYCIFVYLIF